jgi:A/G-specific adenine glycosylase
LARIFNLQTSIDKTAGREFLWNRAKQLVPEQAAARFNSALVDLGALICLPRKPRCRICPVRKFCRATNPEILPVRKTSPRTKQLTENHAFVVRQNKILLEPSRSRLCGMWILPRLQTRAPKRQPLYRSIFPFTHHRVALKVYQRRLYEIDMSSQRWIRIRSLDRMPVPSPHRRAIKYLLTAGRA